MGGSAPSAPTLDTGKSKELTAAELKVKREEIGPTTTAAGDASRLEFSKNLEFALRGFTNPASVVYGGRIDAAQSRIGRLQDQLKDLQGAEKRGEISEKAYKQQLKDLQGRIGKNEAQIGRLRDKDPVADLKKAFRPEFRARDALLKDMRGAKESTPEYLRMQQAYGRGLTAQQTESGALGDRLMGEAMAKMDQGGQLSPEAARDATQAARSGMAARGMATGNAGLGAELLNRDRYAREREFQNLGFAQNVQTQDLGRRQVNTAMRDDTNRFNMGLLGTSAQMSEAERARQLALGQDAYNFRIATNPKMMLAGLGSPYANMTQPAMGMIGGVNMQPIYSGGSPGTAGQNMMLAGTLGGGALAAGGMVAGAAII